MFGGATAFSASAQAPCGSELLLALFNFGSDTPYHKFAIGCADVPPGTESSVPPASGNTTTGIGSLGRRRSAREVPVSQAILGTAQPGAAEAAASAKRRLLAASSVDVKTRAALRSLLWGYNQKHGGEGNNNSNSPPSAPPPAQDGTPAHFPGKEQDGSTDQSTAEGSVAFIPVGVLESTAPSVDDGASSSSEPSSGSPTFPVPEDSSLGGGSGEEGRKGPPAARCSCTVTVTRSARQCCSARACSRTLNACNIHGSSVVCFLHSFLLSADWCLACLHYRRRLGVGWR
jgi:hypothetical protein